MKKSSLYLIVAIFVLSALLYLSGRFFESQNPHQDVVEATPMPAVIEEKQGVDADDVYRALDEEDFGKARQLIHGIDSPLLQESLTQEMNPLIEAKLLSSASDQTLLDQFLLDQCPYEDFWLEVAMRARLSVDADHTLRWFEAHKAELKATMLERAALALSRYYGNLLDWQKAREFHALIQDEELATVVDGEIGGSMERRLRRDVIANPEAMMESLLQKDSIYEVFWLEVAMNELLVNRPEVASAWYQSVKAKLLPEQHERIALACLRLHLNQKRVDEAKKWRPWIVTAELAEVVDRELSADR